MTDTLILMSFTAGLLALGVAMRPWRHLDSDELIDGFPVGPFMWMGLFGVIGLTAALVAQVTHLLWGWPGMTYSDWEGIW